mgnify:CR=1 FL=1|jgi:signal peptidase I
MPIDHGDNDLSPKSVLKKSGGLFETVRTIVYAVMIAFFIRTFAYEPFNIPSGSMIPTLLVGDYLFVSKFSYGYSKHSFPLSLAPIEGRVFSSKPKRGDVAVFKLPTDNKTDYIKRIIGLPGDRIQMKKGLLHVNGSHVRRKPLKKFQLTAAFGQVRRVAQYVQTLPNEKKHLIIEEQGDFGPLDDTQEFVVPEGYYFAMGDNRDNSLDSRAISITPNGRKIMPVGFVPFENLVGRAEFLFFSTDGSARLWEIWKWPFAIRYGRLFNSIE